MKLTPQHLQASYEIYMKYGNSSSATILSVLNKLRETEGKDRVVACAFGPGIALEMTILRRRKEVASSVNRSEHNAASSILSTDGAGSRNTAINGNNITHANGTAKTMDDFPIESEQPGNVGTTADKAASSWNDDREATAEGSTRANEANGSAGGLPVEDLD